MAQNQVFRGTARAKLTLDNGDLAYIYHSTAVLTRKADGSIVLNSGGYSTATTKLAMNQALNELGRPERVYQERGKWYVRVNGGVVSFADGMSID